MNTSCLDSAPSSTRSSSATASYRIRLARSQSDVRAAQALRFLVFNLELQEGLERSFDTCLDADPFDAACDHLLVEDVASGEAVGTYRLQTGSCAGLAHGYYGEQEFDFAPYEPLRPRLLELGRACIHAEHRSFSVLNLLWKGIALYAQERGARYLIGCSSLKSQDPAVGAAAYRSLRPHLVRPEWRTEPVGAYRCPMDGPSIDQTSIPRLLGAYISLGAHICGPPALDREFRTIDFLTLLDLNELPTGARLRWGLGDAE